MRATIKNTLMTTTAALLAASATPALAGGPLEEPVEEKEFVEVGSFRGSILLPGTGISFKIGGYAKGDFIYTFEDFAPGGGTQGLNEAAFAPSAFGGTGGDRARFHALQSRINFDARTTTDIGTARAFIEVDIFNGAGTELVSNSANPRLRHAFAELGVESLGGSLLFGQNWTNFGDLGSFHSTLDFNGPNAQIFIRQPQIRWTQPINEALTISVAAENPEFGGAASGPDNGLDSVPDFTIAIKHKSSIGNFHLGGLLRYFDVDNGANPTLSDDTAFGWGVQFAGTVNVGEKDKIRFQVNYGDGIGRYLQFNPAGALTTATGDLETVEALGITGSYQHFWSDKLQSNFVGGFVRVDDLGDAAGNVTGLGLDSEIYGAVNLIYSPRSNITLGIEGLYGRNTFEDPGLDDLDGFRLQSSIQFNF